MPASRCAVLYLFIGEAAAKACIDRYIGFSPACRDMWAFNMGCTITHCLGPCIAGRATPLHGVHSDGGDGSTDTLNPCLLCDELHCSPTFMRVGGANRRSGGVETDIRRRDGEVCELGASPAELLRGELAARAAAAEEAEAAGADE